MCFKNVQKNTSGKYKTKQSKSLLFGQSLACFLCFCMCVCWGGGVQAGMHMCVLQRNETGLYHFLTKKKKKGEKKRNLRGKEKDHFNLKAILSQYWNTAYNNIPNFIVHEVWNNVQI